jgi:hypothetical protein
MTDEDEIRDFLAVWAQRHADRDWMNWSLMFATDANYTTSEGRTFAGRAAIYRAAGAAPSGREQPPRVTYVCAPAVIRIQGKHAEAASDYVAYARSGADSAWTIQAVGRLIHKLDRKRKGWLLTEVREWAYFSGSDTPAPLPSVARVQA